MLNPPKQGLKKHQKTGVLRQLFLLAPRWPLEGRVDGIWELGRVGYGESGGWDMEKLEDRIWRARRMGYGESGG